MNSQVVFLIMICIGNPIWLGMALLAYIVGKGVKTRGKAILEAGVEYKGSRGFGTPSSDRHVKTKNDFRWVKLYISYSYVFFGFSLFMIILTIWFTAYAYWVSFIR